MTAAEAARELERRARRLKTELLRAEKANGKLALDAAHDLSSGPFTTAELAALDRPYAKRHPAPTLDPAIINRQSGDFDRMWIPVPPKEVAGDLVTTVVNVDPKADLLADGDATTVARPLPEKAMAMIENQVERNRRDAIDRALS